MADIDLSLVEFIEESPGVPMAIAVAPGETVPFDIRFNIAGEPTRNVGVVVLTPPNPNGGFEITGKSAAGLVSGKNYKADSFNNSVGTLAAGHSGTLEGSNSIRIRGMLANGDQPGLLRIAVGPPEPVISVWASASFVKTDPPEGAIVLQQFQTTDPTFPYYALAYILAEELAFLLRDYFEPGQLSHYTSDGAIVPFPGSDSITISISGEEGQVLIVAWAGYDGAGLMGFVLTGDWADLTLGNFGGKYVFAGTETKTFTISLTNGSVRDNVMVIAAAVVTPG